MILCSSAHGSITLDGANGPKLVSFFEFVRHALPPPLTLAVACRFLHRSL
jgi:hypothetical protein